MACDPDRIHAACLDSPASKGDRDSGAGAGKTLAGSPELGPRPAQSQPPTALLPQPPGLEWLWQGGREGPEQACSQKMLPLLLPGPIPFPLSPLPQPPVQRPTGRSFSLHIPPGSPVST